MSDRDRETVRRGLRAGLLTWAAVAAALVVGALVTGGSGRAGAVAVALGLVVGALVASGWLLLALALDLLAGRFPDRRRTLWTAGVVLFTLLSPVFVVGAHGA